MDDNILYIFMNKNEDKFYIESFLVLVKLVIVLLIIM